MSCLSLLFSYAVLWRVPEAKHDRHNQFSARLAMSTLVPPSPCTILRVGKLLSLVPWARMNAVTNAKEIRPLL